MSQFYMKKPKTKRATKCSQPRGTYSCQQIVSWSPKWLRRNSFTIIVNINLIVLALVFSSCQANKFNTKDGDQFIQNIFAHNENQYLNLISPHRTHQYLQKIQPNLVSNDIYTQSRAPVPLKNPSLNQRADLGRHRQSRDHVLLPNGPPPFKPSTIVLSLNSLGALDKLKGTKIFKKMYRSKAYYLYLDVLQQLTVLADKVARKKVDLAKANMAAIQAVTNKVVWRGGQKLKLKWPLVMLNPNFLKEILSNPTFLVMLFHAIEVAYMSMPVNFWLKPLVRLVKQASPEKEEEVWWRRKRLYDTLNGHGTSELQPNLRTVHFRHPGEPTPVAFPRLVQAIRHLAGRPAPDPTYYSYPPDSIAAYNTQTQSHEDVPSSSMYSWDETLAQPPITSIYGDDDRQVEPSSQSLGQDQMYMSAAQEGSFLANQVQTSSDEHSPRPSKQMKSMYNSGFDSATEAENIEHLEPATELSGSKANWAFELTSASLPTNHHIDSASKQRRPTQNSLEHLHQSPEFVSGSEHSDWLTKHRGQLMSPTEFETLDPQQREMVLREARRSLVEAGFTDRLIKQQSKLVESFASRNDSPLALPDLMSPRAASSSVIGEYAEPKGELLLYEQRRKTDQSSSNARQTIRNRDRRRA